MNHVMHAMNQAAELIQQAYRRAVEQGTLPEHPFERVPVEIPKDNKNGDYASSFAMQAAKALGMPPRKIAEAVCAAIAEAGVACKVKRVGVMDEFGHSGPAKELLAQFGLDAAGIAKACREV